MSGIAHRRKVMSGSSNIRKLAEAHPVATTAQITKKELWHRYLSLRSRGLTPAQILSDYLTELHTCGFSVGGLMSVVIGIIAFVVIDNILGGKRSRNHEIDGGLWVVSGDDSQPVKLPFWVAVRIIRKRGWELADVEPVHITPSPLTRWEHLKMAFGWPLIREWRKSEIGGIQSDNTKTSR